jgi:hypothetical protein
LLNWVLAFPSGMYQLIRFKFVLVVCSVFISKLQMAESLYVKAGHEWHPQMAQYKGKNPIPYVLVAMLCETDFR